MCTTLVTSMNQLFYNQTSFNSDISFWDTSNVTTMEWTFANSGFNSNIGNWDTSNVTSMYNMFAITTAFNQDLTDWCVTNISSEPSGFSSSSPLTNANKPVWGTCPTD